MSALPGTTGRRRIYLMRHGHVDYFAKGVQESGTPNLVPLTALGREQAEASGKALSHIRFDLAICSGYPRTRETAEIVLKQNEETQVTLDIDEDLVELKGGKFYPVSSRAELSALMAFEFDSADKPGARLFEGEAFTDALTRGRRGIERLLARPDWSTALVVAHEGINRVILGWMTSAGLRAMRAFEQDLACVNVLDFDMVPREDGSVGTEIQRAIIKSVNLTPYNWTKHGMNLTSLETIFGRYTPGS